MDDCPKTSAGVVAALPDDLVVEILSRVPAKSVCRFKCVSKAWRDLIADPDHRKKLRHAMQGFFIMTPAESMGQFGFIGFMDLTGSMPLDDDPGFFLTERFGMHNLVLQDSCNGLILFRHQKEPPHYAELSDIVCNPTTKQWGYVPTCGPPDRFKHTFLAFDPAVSSQFHLVQFQISEDQRLKALHAYSSETGTWSHNQIDSQEGLLAGWHHHVRLSYEDPRCAFLNAFLYLVVWDLYQLQSRIVVVDVQGKARRMITVPGVADEGHLYCYLEQSQGCLHFMTKEILYAPEVMYKLSIWVLQDDDTQEWVLKNTVSSLEVYGELIGHRLLDFRVVDIHQGRNVVFLFQYDSGKFIAYDMDQGSECYWHFRRAENSVRFCSLCSLFLRIPGSHKLALIVSAKYELLAA